MEFFDEEEIYDERIAPLMTRIIDICKDSNIPFFATFIYGNSADGTEHCTTKLPGIGKRNSAEITKLMNALQGPENGYAAFTITRSDNA